MRFSAVGLITDDQGDQFLYIPWNHVQGLWKWVVLEAKPYQTYPGQIFTREQVGFILSNFADG
jgi:hypothetical protein